jgi:hypothetical protein
MAALFPLFAHNIYVWDLPLLIVIVSLVYSATRFDQWMPILREAFRWGLRLAVFLGGIGLVLYVVNRF